MDEAGVDSAHIVGAKTGGAVAMRFAADYPKRTRALVVVGGPASSLQIADPSPIPQRDRLGSNASKEMIAYANTLFSRPDREGAKGLNRSLSNFDLAKEGVLQPITAPTLVITADRSKIHSVEKARAYQLQIPNSRLVVIRSDAYDIAAADADECITHTLAFLKEQKT
jgi:pimeloyl-ACP methyl ester carboxylesterase